MDIDHFLKSVNFQLPSISIVDIVAVENRAGGESTGRSKDAQIYQESIVECR
jgi:hypothetical protein